MARFSLEADIVPTVDERAAEREGQDLAQSLESSVGSITPDIDSSGIGGLGGARSNVGGGRTAGVGAAGGRSMIALAVERNEWLERIGESLDEEFVGSSGGDGGGGGITNLFAGGAGAKAGAGILSSLGLSGAAGITALSAIPAARSAQRQGAFGEAGRETVQNRVKFEGLDGLRNILEDPFAGAASRFLQTIDPTGLGATAARALMDETTLDEELISGAKRGLRFWKGLEWPDVPGEIESFLGWSWPGMPDWIDTFMNWQPTAPDWLYDIPGVNRGGGGQAQGTNAQVPGGRGPSRDGSVTTNNATQGQSDIQLRLDNTFNIDPQRLAEETERAAQQAAQDAVENLRRELRNAFGDASGFGASPGRR